MNDFFDSLKDIKKELTKEKGDIKKIKKKPFLIQKKRRSHIKKIS